MVRAEAVLRADTTSLCIISRDILRVQAASLSRCGQQSETCCARPRAVSRVGWQRSWLLVTTGQPRLRALTCPLQCKWQVLYLLKRCRGFALTYRSLLVCIKTWARSASQAGVGVQGAAGTRALANSCSQSCVTAAPL